MKIRILTQNDWKIWKTFRLNALKDSPNNFGSSFEEEFNLSDLDFQEGMTKSQIFCAFADDALVSSAGFYSLQTDKTRHRGIIWGMYTLPEYREKGFASALMKTVIEHAKSRVSQIHLTCVTSNDIGLKFYLKHGFKIYGTEPKALKVNDIYFDEHLMVFDVSE
jgi:ribosomal protein S18 acetylase RimI-like enzyme